MGKQKDSTAWYIEPIGTYSERALYTLLPGVDISKLMCADGVSRPLCPVTLDERKYAERSRETDEHLHFSVWCKNGRIGEIEKWKDDKTYIQRNPSLYHRRKRGLRKSLKIGEGTSARIPPRMRPRSFES